MPSETTSASFDDARLLAAQGEESSALAALGVLLERDPGHVEALLLEATLRLQLRDETRALSSFERAAALAPESAAALDGLARCLHALGRDQEALPVALAAREKLARPENYLQTAPVYLTLVWVYRELQRYEEALALAEEGLERCPDAILAQWASLVEEELAAAEQERC